MENRITLLRPTAVILLVILTATCAMGADICAEVKNTARNARETLQAYHDEKMKYPDRLSVTSFNPPEHIVVIYEKMNLNPSREIYMVRAYNENCSTMYLAVPDSPEIYEVPAGPGSPRKTLEKPFPVKAPPPVTPVSGIPILASLATFLMVFMVIVLVFYIFNRKPVSAAKPEKDDQSPSNDCI